MRAAILGTAAVGSTVDGQGKGKGKGNNSAAAQNGWLFNLSEGKRQAAASGKPLMVVIRCEP
jgi:hypothetical protein